MGLGPYAPVELQNGHVISMVNVSVDLLKDRVFILGILVTPATLQEHYRASSSTRAVLSWFTCGGCVP